MSDLFNYVTTDYSVFEFEDYCVIPEKTQVDPEDIFNAMNFVGKYPQEWKTKQEYKSENSYLTHYGNPLAKVYIKRNTVVVTKKDGKVSIKAFQYQRERLAGKKYFRVWTSVYYLTYNTITKSVYHGHIKDYHKKRKCVKKVRRNTFYDSPFETLMNHIFYMFNQNVILKSQVKHTFFENILSAKEYDEYIKEYDGTTILYKLYLDGIKVKTPNNWNVFSKVYPSPKKKDYVKHKLKFIDTFMKVQNLKGDTVKKILHTVDNVHGVDLFKQVIGLYGYDMVIRESEDFIKSMIEFNESGGIHQDINALTKKEKLKSLKILEFVVNRDIDFNTFNDHLRMFNRLKLLEPVEWKAEDIKSFQEEHLYFTERISFYTSGDYYRIYNKTFIDNIEKVIYDGNVEYYPVLLKSSQNYNEESFVQSNCVKTYINKSSSLIISLRKGGPNSTERASIEYRISEDDEKNLKLDRVQTLGKFNKMLNESWGDPISSLDTLIFNSTKDFVLPKLSVTVAGKKIKSDSRFVKNNGYQHLKWTNQQVYNIGQPDYVLIEGDLPFQDYLLDDDLLLDLP